MHTYVCIGARHAAPIRGGDAAMDAALDAASDQRQDAAPVLAAQPVAARRRVARRLDARRLDARRRDEGLSRLARVAAAPGVLGCE